MPSRDPSRKPHTPAAGGALVAVSAIVGAVVGYLWNQPSLGFLLGLGVGAALATAVWLGDRER
jgi:zinc transporter ZupT